MKLTKEQLDKAYVNDEQYAAAIGVSVERLRSAFSDVPVPRDSSIEHLAKITGQSSESIREEVGEFEYAPPTTTYTAEEVLDMLQEVLLENIDLLEERDHLMHEMSERLEQAKWTR